jgi:hypothetical protein
MGGWRVCIAFGDPPRTLASCRRALIDALGGRLGDQVAVTSSRTQIFVYPPSAESADEATQVAREVLARYDLSTRVEFWSPREGMWRDVTGKPSVAAKLQAEYEYFQEREREASVKYGLPSWAVRVKLPSHRDVVALAAHLAAQGWRVRPHRRYLIVGADCEEDAKSLARALYRLRAGDGRANADTAFRIGRVDLYGSWSWIAIGG